MVPHYACLEQVSFIFAVVLIFINISRVPTSIILLAFLSSMLVWDFKLVMGCANLSFFITALQGWTD